MLAAAPINGSSRWLSVGPLTFQPSELAKIAVVVFLAYQIHRCPEGVSQPRVLVPCGLAVGLVTLLVLQAPDFGSAALILGIAGVVLFLAGLSWRWIVPAMVVLPGLFAVFIWLEPYRRERLLGFLSPENDPSGNGFQVLQSLIAIGSGGLTGQGLGGERPEALLPAAREFRLHLLDRQRGTRAARRRPRCLPRFRRACLGAAMSPDTALRILSVASLPGGLTSAVLIQVLVNVSVTVGLVPVTGTPLPFLSHGGSSLVMTLIACGLLLSVSEHG